MEDFARYLLRDVLGARSGERLLLVADADRAPAAEATTLLGNRLGATTELIITREDYRREADTPPQILDAVEACDAALFFVDYPRVQFGGHSDFRKRAVARGARIGFVAHDGLDAEPAALAEVAARTFRLVELLAEARRAVVTSSAGTRLELDVTGRPGNPLTNDLRAPGAWGALPDYFEAAVAPLEGTAEGTAVIDGTALVTGVATEPMHLTIRHGVVTDLTGGASDRLRVYLDDAGEHATNVAELGIGTNHLADPSVLTGTFEDKKIAGTAHLGIGDNRGLGGVTKAAIHTDVQMLGVRVELDGRAVVDAGRLLL